MYYIDFQDDAREDMKEIKLYYNSIDIALFDSFKYDLNQILDVISIFPKTYQLIYKNIRIAHLQRFSYVVYYEIREQNIFIHAVSHTSQERNTKL
ncbi:type II toxin-antitoxin system RelE/ParE family toxin [Tenacibaculum xiamenense]|uniref:type II toxin-antitoxin system RelE/ParE family toxin n=1 Tax=Tenacibaculum xiamenense TaxID=1261553 RepID=UPI0038939DED